MLASNPWQHLSKLSKPSSCSAAAQLLQQFRGCTRQATSDVYSAARCQGTAATAAAAPAGSSTAAAAAPNLPSAAGAAPQSTHHPSEATSATAGQQRRRKLQNVQPLSWFVHAAAVPGTSTQQATGPSPAAATAEQQSGASMHPPGRKVHVETYGCQMNIADSEVVGRLLQQQGYGFTSGAHDADVVLINTCAIRENAESRIWGRLAQLRDTRKTRLQQGRPPLVVGVLGCMAERLKHQLLDARKLADVVVGPDAYRDLPRLLQLVQDDPAAAANGAALNVQLSLEETYADVAPLRQPSTTSAFLAIMRGCNNMCSFCIVPYTRGRERSRPAASIVDEVKQLAEQGVKEVTLLGQNVNSYADSSRSTAVTLGSSGGSSSSSSPFAPSSRDHRPAASSTEVQLPVFSAHYAPGFSSVYRPKRDGTVSFAELLHLVACVDPEMRIRYTSPHPKDFTDDVLHVIAAHPNICKQLHMPAQSGSTSTLQRMRRGYSREAYDALIQRTRQALPRVALSTDIITGFCEETDEEHAATLDLLQQTRFDSAFLFSYSQRAKTHAARHLPDDVPADVKARRLQEALQAYREGQRQLVAVEPGSMHIVLLEGRPKRGEGLWQGRSCTMKRVIIPDIPVPCSLIGALQGARSNQAQQQDPQVLLQPGDYVAVHISSVSGNSTLLGTPIARTSTHEFVQVFGSTVPGVVNPEQLPLLNGWTDPAGCAAARTGSAQVLQLQPAAAVQSAASAS